MRRERLREVVGAVEREPQRRVRGRVRELREREVDVELEEEREISDDLTYLWEQETYNPINHETLCHISFDFSDGSSMTRAFTYDWRLWSIPELREILEEAGFSRTAVYWEEVDDEGDAAPTRAGTVDDANFRAWQRVASNAKASSRPEKKDASKASTPPSPFGSDIDALAAPDGSYVPLGENTHASFHDLGPEEKRKVAKLIRQVVELSEARSKLEKELDELRARCSTEEGARKDAEAAEANSKRRFN